MSNPKDERSLQPDTGAPPGSSEPAPGQQPPQGEQAQTQQAAGSTVNSATGAANSTAGGAAAPAPAPPSAPAGNGIQAQPTPSVQQVLDHQRELLAKPIAGKLAADIDVMRQIYSDCSDVIIHEFDVREGPAVAVIYLDGLCDTKEIDLHILNPLQHTGTSGAADKGAIVKCVTLSSMLEVSSMQDATDKIGYGNVLLFINGETSALVYSLMHLTLRSIEEPQAETVVRGPREGFVENIQTNISLLRRRIHSPAMKMKSVYIGRYTKTATVIAYIEGITDPNLVKEMEQRLSVIDIDGFMDSSHIEEWVEDNPFSPFPQLMSTERPDVVTAHLLEGKIVVFTDGSPVALIAPALLMSMMQSPEDFYQRSLVATFIRWLRMLFSFITVFGPSLYVAVLSYHQEMIPTTLLLTIARSREQIPFPALVEALLMEITFEALREAGIRLPRQVGSAVSIVGALVIGQAAIAAGIVSSPMVMVVAVTAVSSFLIPNYALGIAIRFIRFPIMLCAGFLGLYGIVLAALVILLHLMTLRSFGVPYLSPIAPVQSSQFKDTLIRANRWHMKTRPHLTGSFFNRIRSRADLYKSRRNY
ncbi:GerA spore germination protein [Paenibacillus curdlanolyticus YK9]|uniref:GerA spore germination protein n=1 Tax=Paenibacillus curdlanolyticus YK9 TaxID=717606 RepID=E0IEI9_9BACL|nr:spore germination protein [Paenibacillus curdlanolyticus]EFM09077.1 GerA spore germination protein [Paenibacillus curdlanolyticus YK9]